LDPSSGYVEVKFQGPATLRKGIERALLDGDSRVKEVAFT
jgi:hypothetical protein